MSRVIVAAILAGEWLASSAAAQGRPDFTGRWTTEPPAVVPSARDAAASGAPPPPRVDLGSGWGRTITITQDERTLTVEWAFFSAYDLQPPLRFVYALDGSETVNAFMMGRGSQRQRSHVSWNGGSMLITTVHTFADPANGRPVESEVRQTLTLESPTSLVIETVRGAALGGPATTTRTVYTKGTGP